MTKGVRKPGKTLKDSERRRLARRSRTDAAANAELPPPAGWAVLWCDGGSRGNPGPAAYAFVIESAEGAELAATSEPIGVATAGTAEYRAVVAGLEAAAELDLDRVEVRTDSRLVTDGLGSARGGVRNPELRRLRDRAVEASQRIGTVTYRWVPADHNGRADVMVAELLV